MMKRSFAVFAAVGMSVVLAACGGSDGPTVEAGQSSTTQSSTSASSSSSSDTTSSSSSTSSETSTSSSTSSTTTTTAPVDFAVGDCLRNKTYEKVACTDNHELEVSAVVPNTQYTDDLVKRTALRNYTCLSAAGTYTGGPAYGTLWLGDGITPSKDPKSNERIACVVMLYKNDDSGVQSINYSAKDAIKKDGFDKYQFCTSSLPSGDSVKLTPCNGPHVAESTGGFMTGKFGDPYPGLAKNNAAMYAKCKPISQKYLGTTTRTDIIPSQNSSPESGWKRGVQITACFVETNGTKVTKSMKGIGNKPLSSVQ